MLQRDNLFRRREDFMARAPAAAPVSLALSPAPALAVASQAAITANDTPAAPASRPGEGSKLIVGPDVKLKAIEITDCDTLVVEGRVESRLDSRVIQIAEHGVFNGTASIDIAEIRGRFDGELSAREQLVILATGRVSGKIRYGKIRIEEGGEITGDISALDGEAGVVAAVR